MMRHARFGAVRDCSVDTVPPILPSVPGAVDLPQVLLAAAANLYAANVRWHAPRRGITRSGRDEVVRHLLLECAAMRGAVFVPVRRAAVPGRIIDEYAVRFVYAGEGIERAPLAAGDRAELERLRVLDLVGGRVAVETCIETWTVLPRD